MLSFEHHLKALMAGGGFTVPDPVPLTLADIEPYRTSATTWKGVPWGPVTWVEGSKTYSQVIDIYMPSTAAPVGGRMWAARAHAATADYDIVDGSALYQAFVQACINNNIVAFAISARHPVLSSTPTEFHDRDFGRCIQFIKALATALEINGEKGHFLTQSRGSGVINDLLQPDLQNPAGATFAERQSSRGVRLVYAANPQAWHDSADEAPEYLSTQADIDAALAEYPPDSRQRNAVDLIGTADLAAIPNLVALYDATFQASKVSWAQMQAAGGVLHYPNQGLSYRTAYAGRGLSAKCVVTDQSGTGIAALFSDFVPTILGLEAGLTLAQALSVARSARQSHSLIYIPPSLAGATVNSDGLGGTSVVGGNVGGISDKSQGISSTATANGAGQVIAANKPKLAQIGSQYGLLFSDATDALICQRANTGAAGCFAAWTTTALTTTPTNQTTNQIAWSVGSGNTQTLAVIGAVPLTKADRTLYSHLASEVAGADLFTVTT